MKLNINSKLQFTLLLTLFGSIAFWLTLIWESAAVRGDEFFPVMRDSFYHARRIMDLVATEHSFFEYDNYTYFPHGSWVYWPWAYDYIMGIITRVITWAFNINNPMQVLVYLPAAAVFISTAIFICISKCLRLRLFWLCLALLCFSLSPLTQVLHGVGRIDHHYMEYIFSLATLLMLLKVADNPSSTSRCFMLGFVLGLAPSVQNGLFILQLPVLMYFFIIWLKKQNIEQKTVLSIAIGLCIANILILIPSEPFQRMMFKYYLLSWFHFYVAACSSLILGWFAWFKFSKNSLSRLTLLIVLLAIPVLEQFLVGANFIKSEVDVFNSTGEFSTVFGLTQATQYHWYYSWQNYSGLVWISPIFILWGLGTLYCSDKPLELAFAAFTIFGLVLLHLQFRLHVFGSFALYLPLLWILNNITNDNFTVKNNLLNKFSTKGIKLITCLILLIAYAPCASLLLSKPNLGMSYRYERGIDVFKTLEKECASNPGVVLVWPDFGHYIRYHSDCKVVANNMMLTQQDSERRLDLRNYFKQPAKELRNQLPWMKYILVYHKSGVHGYLTDKNNLSQKQLVRHFSSALEEELLSNQEHPEGYQLIHEVLADYDNHSLPYMRLYRVLHLDQKQ